MGFFSRLFGGGKGGGDGAHGSGDAAGEEHALLLHIKLANDQFGDPDEVGVMHALQDEIESALAAAGAGELDGDEFGGGLCTIYIYGPDADAMWAAVAPVLEKRPFRKGSVAVKRYGGPGSGREEPVDLFWEG